jgi:hypothetical protein
MNLHSAKKLSAITAGAALLSLCAISAFAGPVSEYGRLYASGNKIVGEKTGGEAVQLKGPSMQWSVSGWGSDKFFIEETVNAMVDVDNGWKAKVIRAPLGIDFEKRTDHKVTGGYITKPAENWARVMTVVDAAVAKDVYAIVDWHSHTAHDSAETALAIDFFTNPNLAGKYGDNPAVIFEIYNEPENDVTWAKVKAYSTAVIKAIRDAGFNNLILVGSPNWDTQTNTAAADPPDDPDNNIAFTFHFYTVNNPLSTHRSRVQGALNVNKPVFVSEWGTNDASSTGKPNFVETDKWHAYLDSNKISSCAWGVTASDYNVLDYWTGVGSPLNYGKSDLANWTKPGMMTAHGRYIYRWLTGKDTTGTSTMPGFPEFDGPTIPILLDSMYSFSDATDSGATIQSLSVESGIAHLTYTLNKGHYDWAPYAAAGIRVEGMSECGYGIGYSYKGSTHVLRAEQSNIKAWAYHENFVPTGDVDDWTEVKVPWNYFQQPVWTPPDSAVPQDFTKVTALAWNREGTTGTSGELWIKDVKCLVQNTVSVKPNSGTASHKSAASFMRVSNNQLRLRMAQAGKLEIFDLRGIKLRTVKLKQGDHVVKLGNLPGGMYVVKASGADGWRGTVKAAVRR